MAMMLLKDPFKISSRLLPSLEIGEATISVELKRRDETGRNHFILHIDFNDGMEYQDPTLSTRRGFVDAFATALDFLDNDAEAFDFNKKGGKIEGCGFHFPDYISEWASKNREEISLLAYRLSEEDSREFIEGDTLVLA